MCIHITGHCSKLYLAYQSACIVATLYKAAFAKGNTDFIPLNYSRLINDTNKGSGSILLFFTLICSFNCFDIIYLKCFSGCSDSTSAKVSHVTGHIEITLNINRNSSGHIRNRTAIFNSSCYTSGIPCSCYKINSLCITVKLHIINSTAVHHPSDYATKIVNTTG